MPIIEYTASDQLLRNRVKAFLDERFPPERQIEALIEQHEHQEHIDQTWERAFWREMGAEGFLGLGIPEEYGGSGGTALQKHIFVREMSYYGAPYPRTAVQIVAPALLAFGSEDQKARYLPRIAAGEINFCLGYTEPESGTDLASLRTRAVRQGDGYVVNGEKVYTTRAHRCDYCYLAARTSLEGGKHAGISLLIVDMKAKGVSVEPLHVLGGRTNTTYYDDVFVPEADLVGEENQGWKYLTYSLGLERLGVFPTGHVIRLYEEILKLAKRPRRDGTVPFTSPTVRRALVELHIDLRGLEAMLDGAMAEVVETGSLPNHVAGAIKTVLTEFKQEVSDVALDFLGPDAQFTADCDLAPFDGIIETMWRDAIVHTFGGGANEVQRDMVAVRGLGLPRAK